MEDYTYLFEELINEEVFFEMANFHKEESGLKHNIWLDEMGKDRKNTHHLMRIKVEDPKDKTNLVPVEISKSPKILAGAFTNKNEDISDVYEFIKRAYDDLVAHWNKQMTSLQFMKKYSI